MEPTTSTLHPLAPAHLPGFITAPGETDQMMINVGVFLVVAILLLGVGYLTLHSVPERLAHKGNSMQFQLIGVLALLALVTHNNIFWLIAVVLAIVKIPDFMTPLNSIARSLEKATGRESDPVPGPDTPSDHGKAGTHDHV